MSKKKIKKKKIKKKKIKTRKLIKNEKSNSFEETGGWESNPFVGPVG